MVASFTAVLGNGSRARPVTTLVLGAAAIAGIAVAEGLYLASAWNNPQGRAALQQECASCARRSFMAAGWSLGGRQPDGGFAGYRSSYNARLGKCFVRIGVLTIDPRDHESRFSSTLADAFEQTTYAEYFESRTHGLAPYVTCKLTPPGGKTVFCHSAKDYRRLTAPYVGVAALKR